MKRRTDTQAQQYRIRAEYAQRMATKAWLELASMQHALAGNYGALALTQAEDGNVYPMRGDGQTGHKR